MPDQNEQEWALQRRLDDVFAKIGEKYGDLTGRVEVKLRPGVSFDEVGGLAAAKGMLQGYAYALTNPELYHRWGISPPRGVLLYGPPGTGKTMLARALESKVRRAAAGQEATAVTTADMLLAIDSHKGVRGVVEKIRYGQYL